MSIEKLKDAIAKYELSYRVRPRGIRVSNDLFSLLSDRGLITRRRNDSLPIKPIEALLDEGNFAIEYFFDGDIFVEVRDELGALDFELSPNP